MSTKNIPQKYADKKTLDDKEFLKAEIDMGIGFHNQGFVNLGNATANRVIDLGGIKTAIDYGAGTGVYTKCLMDAGIDVLCVELFDAHREYIKKHIPNVNLLKELEKDKVVTADLLLWIEVAEHMTDTEIDAMLKKIDVKYIYFSSTSEKTENDEMWGHINLKEQDDWIKFFSDRGYTLYKNMNVPTHWTKIFKKNN